MGQFFVLSGTVRSFRLMLLGGSGIGWRWPFLSWGTMWPPQMFPASGPSSSVPFLQRLWFYVGWPKGTPPTAPAHIETLRGGHPARPGHPIYGVQEAPQPVPCHFCPHVSPGSTHVHILTNSDPSPRGSMPLPLAPNLVSPSRRPQSTAYLPSLQGQARTRSPLCLPTAGSAVTPPRVVPLMSA